MKQDEDLTLRGRHHGKAVRQLRSLQHDVNGVVNGGPIVDRLPGTVGLGHLVDHSSPDDRVQPRREPLRRPQSAAAPSTPSPTRPG